jgi:hypothetical protein
MGNLMYLVHCNGIVAELWCSGNSAGATGISGHLWETQFLGHLRGIISQNYMKLFGAKWENFKCCYKQIIGLSKLVISASKSYGINGFSVGLCTLENNP